MNRWVVRFSALGALVATPALAADLTISAATTEPVNTAEGDGGGAGDMTVTSAGSIDLDQLPIPDGDASPPVSVPAITLNSDNSVTNDGSLSVRHTTAPVAIMIEGGNAGNVTNNGSIVVEGTDDGLATTTDDALSTADATGILLDDAGTHTGNIVTGPGSSITAPGITGTGIFLQSRVDGDVLLDGNTTTIGSGSVGVRTTETITGTFRNFGSIDSGPRDDGDGNITPATPGSAVLIGGSVGEGILNDGPNGDATLAAHIGTEGSAPALRISPDSAFADNLTVGVFTDAGLTDYSFINRGEILVQGNFPAVDTTGMQIGGSGGFTTSFTGDFLNSGSIRALATSDGTNAVVQQQIASDAIAIKIDTNATVPELHNAATGIIEAMTNGPSGGTAVAIDISQDASLARLINDGSILANAFSTNDGISGLDAFAVRDLTGDLRHIENNGTVSAIATGANTTTIAFDLREATGPITFVNTGTVIGDVVFGGGVGANTFDIFGPDALVRGAISSIGTVDVTVSDGSGGTLITSGVSNLRDFNVGAGGVVDLEIGQDLGPLIDAQGVSEFAAGSSLLFTPVAFLAETAPGAPYELVRADGGLTIAAGVTDAAEVPFLFTGAFSTDANTLFFDVTLKTAAELGLTGNDAAIYQGVARAALNDDELGALLLGVGSNAAVGDTVEQFVPHDNNISRAAALMLIDPTGSNIAGRQRRLRFLPEATDDGGVWLAGGYDTISATGTNGYDGNGVSGSIGIDWGERGVGHFGLAYSFFNGGADGTGIVGRTVDTNWSVFTLYMGLDNGPLFGNAQINVGAGDIEAQRQINVGGLSRTATSRDWTETLASGTLSGGYLIEFGELQLAPQGGLEYISLGRSSYEEGGGGAGVNLNVRDSRENLFRGFLGTSLGGTIDSGGLVIAPQAHVGVHHNFLNDVEAIVSEFVSAPGTSYTTVGQVPGSTSFVGGIAVDVSMGYWTIGAHYDAIISSGETVHSAGGNLYIKF